ncbi:MAG: hypothetical protein E7048_03205 [Lentisphaerae bacterium]|nr:hypothetical protein [Lentisphaerota bacterium]
MNMRHNKFTLVELLVVICIASLLMGLVLPAFNRMVTGSAVDRLASNLKLRLERAQSHAASSRRHVALLLPHGDTTAWGVDDDTKARAKAAALGGSRMCYVDEIKVADDEYEAKFVRWLPDEDWTTPERGAFIAAFCGGDPVKADGTLDITNKLAHNEPLTLPVVNGSEKGKPLKKIKNIKFNEESSDKKDVADAGIIFSPKGGIRSSSDVYLVVAEAMNNDEKVIFPGGELNNYRVLRINRLTGKVEYHR